MTPRDPLDDLLDRWQPPPDALPDIRSEVRRELTHRRRVAPVAFSWISRLEAVFARPSFAITFVAACMLLGLFLAEARVSRLHAAYSAQISRSYVQLIDPLIENASRSPGATPQHANGLAPDVQSRPKVRL